jgi:hypothetical protein
MQHPFHCPETGTALTRDKEAYTASKGKRYPVIDEIPWIVPHTDQLLSEWQVLAQQTLAELVNQGTLAQEELSRCTLKSSAKRLQKIATAFPDQAKLLENLLAPLLVQPLSAPVSQALQRILPSNQRLFSYLSNVFRDWNWGQEENQATLAMIEKVFPVGNRGTFVFLGCGSGRLMYDVHKKYKPAHSIGIDLNPLLLKIARKMFVGSELSLYEVPALPRTTEKAAVLRSLKAEGKLKGSWDLVLGDMSALPLANGCADVVFTPWLIDILPFETPDVIRTLHALLKPHGTWVQLGPLGFRRRSKRANLTAEELAELTLTQGFEIKQIEGAFLPYIQSPAESGLRTEWITAFSAVRDSQAASRLPLEGLPSWLTHPNEAIPKLKSIETSLYVHRLYAEVLTMIDGKRSIEDVAGLLNQNFSLEASEALGVARRFFRSAWEAELWE